MLYFEEMEAEMQLRGKEVFVTKNPVFEGAFYKGHLDSKLLDGLVL